MEIFQFLIPTKINYFLNCKLLTILRVISNNPDCFTKDIVKLLQEIKYKISKSQIYRYIDCLDKYKLVKKSHYINNHQEKGYKYKISLNGIGVFNILSQNFETKDKKTFFNE